MARGEVTAAGTQERSQFVLTVTVELAERVSSGNVLIQADVSADEDFELAGFEGAGTAEQPSATSVEYEFHVPDIGTYEHRLLFDCPEVDGKVFTANATVDGLPLGSCDTMDREVRARCEP